MEEFQAELPPKKCVLQFNNQKYTTKNTFNLHLSTAAVAITVSHINSAFVRSLQSLFLLQFNSPYFTKVSEWWHADLLHLK